jgi:hypothetical protein
VRETHAVAALSVTLVISREIEVEAVKAVRSLKGVESKV